MDRREELHRVGCSFAKQTILTSHPSGLRARVSVELASVDSVCLHHISSPLKTVHGRSTDWEMGSPFMARRGGLSHHGTPVLGRRSDMVTEGRLSQQCTPVMRRKELMDSPAGSPLLSRRMDMEDTGDECSDVDTSVISGWLKFRDSKRWKSRWGVVTKLSPAADCLHLQLYRDPKDRYKRGQSKASLSLQHFLGFESSFTLDKESNTIAIICQDVTVVLAFETRERLIAWQVKVGSQLGTPRQFLVMVGGGGGGRTLPAGPARLHLLGGRVAVTAGVPPTLLGLWELAHLRRYGVVDGRFCFEGGSQCGKGEGLHVLLTDQAHDVAEAFRHAAEGHLHRNTHGSRNSTTGTVPHRPDTRLSDFNVEQTGSEGSALYEEGLFEGPEREVPAPWSGDDVTLERCGGCAECAGGGGSSGSFTPAWTMEGVTEPQTLDVDVTSYVTSRPARHPPPPRPDQCGCSSDSGFVDNPKVGPYENYDVPKTTPVEVENAEYYDTPKRIKEVLADDLFRVTNASPGSLVLKKNCGCILRLAPKRDTKVSRNEDRLKPAECACQRVTSWASSLIRLPYCRKKLNNDSDNIDGDKAANEDTAIYATVDVSRKTNRQSNHSIGNVVLNEPVRSGENVQGVNDKNNPYANYENLDFAMSLEYYENAKDLLKKAGVTQKELDALSTNFKTSNLLLTKTCSKCGHSQPNESKQDIPKRNKSDEYLLMEPSSSNEIKHVVCNKHGQTLGYTPMSPISNRCHSLKHPPQKSFSVEIEKSSSIPAFYGSKQTSKDVQSDASQSKNRSSSVDSARLLEDLKEFDGSIGSRATSSSLETLRNMAIDNRPSSEEGYEQDWCGKSSSSDHKTESSTDSKEVPNLRNKLIDNAQIKRSSSVPCKSGGNRDSSSSNDSGVSSCSLRLGGPEFGEYGSSPTSGRARQYSCRTRALREVVPCVHASLPRKSKSTELREVSMQLPASAKSSSAEAEVPVLPPKQIRGVMDSRSTSSGTSDMSDYIETLSLSSEHSLSDTHAALRQVRQATSTLRPRSGGEYHQMDAARARAHAAHTPHAPHAMARVPPTFER